MVRQYNQTVSFPRDWTMYSIGEAANYRRGSFPQPYGLPEWYNESGGMPFVQVFDVDDNMLLKSQTKQHISEIAKQWSVYVPRGSIVLTIQGSIGRIALTQYDSYVDRTLLVFTSFNIPVDKRYFMYAVYQVFHSEKESAPGGIIKTITKKHLTEFEVAVPPLSEQRAIANALSDVDAYIAVLEKLIDKKRLIKQGAMQELLTGKRRLPGFSGDWVETTIGEIFIYQNGRSMEHLFSKNGKYKVISIGNYSTDGKYIDNGTRIDECHCNEVSKYIPNIGDFTMILNDKTSTGEIIGRVLLIDKSDMYVINQRTLRLVLRDSRCNIFFYYLLNSFVIRNQIMFAVKPGTQIYINTPDVLNISLLFPSDKAEQTAIAEVLSDMDAEIDVLTEKLNKAKHIKQGMMSELLTGRIRLVEQEPVTDTVSTPKIVSYPFPTADQLLRVAEEPHKGGY